MRKKTASQWVSRIGAIMFGLWTLAAILYCLKLTQEHGHPPGIALIPIVAFVWFIGSVIMLFVFLVLSLMTSDPGDEAAWHIAPNIRAKTLARNEAVRAVGEREVVNAAKANSEITQMQLLNLNINPKNTVEKRRKQYKDRVRRGYRIG